MPHDARHSANRHPRISSRAPSRINLLRWREHAAAEPGPARRRGRALGGELKKRHGDRLEVITVAIESDESGVRKLAGELGLPFFWTTGTPETIRALGDVSAVPTMLLFGPDGRTAATFFGAPPSLHAEAEAKIARLVG